MRPRLVPLVPLVLATALASGCSFSVQSGPSEVSGAALDEAFLLGMVEHHRSAVEMAEVAEDASDPRIRELAERIRVEQASEVEYMESLLASEFPDASVSSSARRSVLFGVPVTTDMSGMLGDLRREADPGPHFVEMMVPHHAAALVMADEVVRGGESETVRALAQEVLAEQAEEIGVLRSLSSVPSAEQGGGSDDEGAPGGGVHGGHGG